MVMKCAGNDPLLYWDSSDFVWRLRHHKSPSVYRMRYVHPGLWQRRFVLGLTFLLALVIAPVQAPISNVSASLEGPLPDSPGAVISRAKVRLRNTATNQTRIITTDDRGLFRANELPVGIYEIRVDQPGFAPYLHPGVALSVGQSLRVSIELVPAAVAEAVTVTDQPSTIDPSQTGLTSAIDTERIEELPVLSRNYLNFVLLAPGVAASNERGLAVLRRNWPTAGSPSGACGHAATISRSTVSTITTSILVQAALSFHSRSCASFR